MAEAERIIGTPDTPDAAGDGQERPEDAAAGERADSEGTRPAGESGTGDAAAPPRGKRRIAVLFVVALFAYALDLSTKMIVVAKLEHHPPIEIIGDWLKFEAIRNAGAAFGFGEAFTVIFTMIAAAVIVVIARLARKLYSLPWALALGLLLGGALGNLTDRIFRAPGVFEGAVVDFIAPKHFAVFNLADSAIVCGGILIVLLSFKGLDPDGTVHKD
ncbi:MULTISPECIES: signal peptidase II [Streptomyces]|uniref:Lipoprotein signal peptidase n=1 Tax=Streptomyces koelreuteriae TaxID=2838015 RepID=A0ABX8FY86_9ACTN|nr:MULTISPECIES: signal peptidase II [Streptomyces]QWB26196.1 signal peptidase II [Streptomyces koelreuteriae]UUA09272.1 signal peptidase II [Streptomyces koelreuteriae]UUA16876.1 signal peptidase II [Streptomyces sp. CRCS-T-1]